MKINPILILTAVVAGLFGLAFLFAPGPLVAQYGAILTPGGEVVGRYFGSVLIALAWIFWAAREGAGGALFQSVLVAGALAHGIELIIALHAIWAGILNALAWTSVVIHIVIGGGLAYFAAGNR
jgi:hypothetical protein